MIQITLTFPSIDAARKAMLELPESLLVSAAPSESKHTGENLATEGRYAEIDMTAKKGQSEAKKEVAKPEPVATPATAETSAAPEPKAESSAPASVDYPTLQKAVFALAAESREAAAEVAASFGVKTFKELPQGKWTEALAAVKAKLAELEAA